MPRKARRNHRSAMAKMIARGLETITRNAIRTGTLTVEQALKPAVQKRRPPPGAGSWIRGMAIGVAGARRFKLYRPPNLKLGERLPLMVMLHGCGQNAKSFAISTRMNRIAARERFLVLYPEQDRVANAQGCWNWYDTTSGRAYGEAALIMNAVDQVCLLNPVDRARLAVAGLSAGASMAVLLATRHPKRFKAVVMHSGIPPGTARTTMSAISAMHGHRPAAPLKAMPVWMAAPWPPLMVIHGGMDHVVATSNGHAAVQLWADGSGARRGKSRRVQRGKRHAMTVTDFKHGKITVAKMVEVGPLGHAWSGGAAKLPFSDAQGPDASRMVWAFAAKQFRL